MHALTVADSRRRRNLKNDGMERLSATRRQKTSNVYKVIFLIEINKNYICIENIIMKYHMIKTDIFPFYKRNKSMSFKDFSTGNKPAKPAADKAAAATKPDTKPAADTPASK
ncbi:MAG: hypothetical protein RIG67_28800 [Rhodospirillales bacterium]